MPKFENQVTVTAFFFGYERRFVLLAPKPNQSALRSVSIDEIDSLFVEDDPHPDIGFTKVAVRMHKEFAIYNGFISTDATKEDRVEAVYRESKAHADGVKQGEQGTAEVAVGIARKGLTEAIEDYVAIPGASPDMMTLMSAQESIRRAAATYNAMLVRFGWAGEKLTIDENYFGRVESIRKARAGQTEAIRETKIGQSMAEDHGPTAQAQAESQSTRHAEKVARHGASFREGVESFRAGQVVKVVDEDGNPPTADKKTFFGTLKKMGL